MSEAGREVLCVSVNPAVDRRLQVPRMIVGAVNRATVVLPTAGGKAAHVAYAAKALGAKVRWLAFVGGMEGDFCRAGVEEQGIEAIPVPIAGRTRTTLEIIAEDDAITEVLEPGPTVSPMEQRRFQEVFEEALHRKPHVVISGSLTAGVPPTFYAPLIAASRQQQCPVFLDTSGPALESSLAAEPDFIKPNRQEVEVLLNRRLTTIDAAREAAEELRALGPKTVIISLGNEGAVVWDGTTALHASPPQLKAVSTVGSGDSFVAGWVHSWLKRKPLRDCLRLAVACGSANCLAPSPGLIVAADVERFLPEIAVSEL